MWLAILSSVAIQGQKINGPLPRDAGAAGGDVTSTVLSPDGDWVVYSADQDVNEVLELFSVPLDGSASSRQLSTGSSATLFEALPAGGSRVLYRSDESLASTFTLRSVPIDGSAAPIELNGALPSGRDVHSFRVSPDGVRAVYLSSEQSSSSTSDDLFSVPCDGSSTRIRLNTPGVDVEEMALTSDGARVVYRQWNGTSEEVFSVPIDGSAAPVRLNETLVSGRNVESFALTPDGSGVVYLADQTVNNRFELYSVPSAGGAPPVSLTPAMPSFAFISHYQTSPSGAQVLFVADAVVDGVAELFLVPFDGSSPPVRLNSALASGRSVQRAQFSTDGTRVAYLADADADNVVELFSVPTDQSSAAIQLNGPLVAGGDVVDVGFLRMLGSRVLYFADQDIDGVDELFSVPVDGSLAPARLNAPLGLGRSVEHSLWETPTGARVLYLADQAADDVLELWSAPTDGSAAATRVNGPLIANGDVAYGLQVTPDGQRVVYRADEQTDELVEAWNAPILGGAPPLRLNAVLSAPPIVGDVSVFGWAPEGREAVYLADEDLDTASELYSVDLGPGLVRTKLNEPLLPPDEFERTSLEALQGKPCLFAPGKRVLFSKSTFHDPFSAFTGVHVASRTGSFASFALVSGNPLVAGERVVYVRSIASGVTEIWSRSLDGSGHVRLSPGSNTHPYAFVAVTSDGARTVFTYRGDLWSAPTDGSVPAMLLGPTFPQHSVNALRIHPSDARVLYVADDSVDNVDELWSVPIDASAPPVRLSQPVAANRDVLPDFLISPDGTRAAFLADADTDEVFELYSVPSGGGAVVTLSGSMTAGGDVAGAGESQAQFAFSPDSAWVVYRADQDADEVHELYAAPADGSQAAVKLNGPLGGARDVPVNGFRITPDSGRVVFVADQDIAGQFELWSAPIDGTQAAMRLNPPMVGGGSLLLVAPYFARDSFALAPGGRHVYYLADQDTDGVVELFRVATDGSGLADKCNAALVNGGDVTGFAVGPTGAKVLYRADQETDEAFELFLTEFAGSPRPKLPAGPPTGFVQRSVP